MKKQYLIMLIVMLFVFSFAFSYAYSNNFPTSEITLIVPTSAGGGSDMTMRTVAAAAEQIIGQPIVVINRPGAGGSIAWSEVAQAKPDGYTIVNINEAHYTQPMAIEDLAYDETSFEPIITVNFDPAALVVRADGQFNNLEDFVSYAKEYPDVLTMGNSGYANIWHLSAVAFEKGAGISFNQVPFTGAAPEILSLLGGHIDAIVASAPEVASQVEAGKLRILAIMGVKRDPNFPEVPTMEELGYDVIIGTWRGIAAPKNTPPEIIKFLHDAFRKGMEHESFVNFMKTRGLGVLYRSSEETKQFIGEDKERFRELMIQIGLIK